MSTTTYLGTELDTFAHASNWKQYLRQLVRPYLQGHVLEVGGGIGATTSAFRSGDQTSWTALEPDAELALRLSERASELRDPVRIVIGTLDAIQPLPLFDCVIYIDVLEHIEKHEEELRRAAARLVTGGAIVCTQPRTSIVVYGVRRSNRSLPPLRPAQSQCADAGRDDAGRYALSRQRRTVVESGEPRSPAVIVTHSRPGVALGSLVHTVLAPDRRAPSSSIWEVDPCGLAPRRLLTTRTQASTTGHIGRGAGSSSHIRHCRSRRPALRPVAVSADQRSDFLARRSIGFPAAITVSLPARARIR